MNIGIDGNEANTPVRVGSGQYAYHILLELHRQNLSDHFYIYLKNPPLADMPPSNAHWHYLVFGPKPLWTKIALPLKLLFSSKKLDVFYTSGHYLPTFCPFPSVVTIHDIGYLKSKEQFTKKDYYQLVNWTLSSLKKASLVTAVSRFTKKELIKTYHLPASKIAVVYNGVEEAPKGLSPQAGKILAKFGLKHPFFLSVGTLKPNKNYPFLIRSFAQFIKIPKFRHYQLVIAGKKGWLYDDISRVVAKLKLEKQVIFTDYISETEKDTLYKKSQALIIPSTYEGFGIPAIEAQIRKVPVIASAIPSLREVLGKTALFINPRQPQTLLKAFRQIQNQALRQKLIRLGLGNAATFTWKNSAKTLKRLFHQKFIQKQL